MSKCIKEGHKPIQDGYGKYLCLDCDRESEKRAQEEWLAGRSKEITIEELEARRIRLSGMVPKS